MYNRNLLEYDMKAKKGDRVLSHHIDPSIIWVIHSLNNTSIVVKDKSNPRDKQTLKHGMYTVAIY